MLEFFTKLLTPIFISLNLINASPVIIEKPIIPVVEQVQQIKKTQEVEKEEVEEKIKKQILESVQKEVVMPDKDITHISLLNGKCGSSENKYFEIAPTSNLCDSGIASNVTVFQSDKFHWRCEGDKSTENCIANISGSIPKCGFEKENIIEFDLIKDKDKDKLCLEGSLLDRPKQINGYLDWTCVGKGREVLNCSVKLKMDGECGKNMQCNIGLVSDVSIDGIYYKEWKCSGLNGGTSSKCTWVDYSDPIKLGCKEPKYDTCTGHNCWLGFTDFGVSCSVYKRTSEHF